MKYTPGIACLIAIAFAHNAWAAQPPSEWHAGCELAQAFARQIMQARQNGIAMSEVMKIATQSSAIAEQGTKVVLAAYREPRFMGEEMQERAIVDFANDAYLQCAEASSE